MGNSRRARKIVKALGRLAAEEAGRRVHRRGGGKGRDRGDEARSRARAARHALEDLGPLYIKVGQMLSTRPDMVSAAMVEEFQKLHDHVAPSPFADFEPVLAGELGPDWAAGFRHVDTENPLGTASLAQVYRAVLADGTPVAVKIQRQGVREVMEADMELLTGLARFAGRRAPRLNAVIDFESMLSVLFDAMHPELDFVLEARNMRTAARAASGFKHIAVPDVIRATPRVLIQTLAPGCSIREADPAAFTVQQRTDIGRDLLAFMYQGYFLDGWFHADPHPGNIFVHPGSPAYLIDWGMVGRIDRSLGTHLLRVLLSVAQNDGTALAQAWIELGDATPWAQVNAFSGDMVALVPKVAAASLEDLDFGLTLTAILERSTKRGIKTNPMIAVLGKSFANIEGSIRYLSPELSLLDVFETEMVPIVQGHIGKFASGPQLVHALLEGIDDTTRTPQQLRGIIRDLAEHRLTVNVAHSQGLPTAWNLLGGASHRIRDAALLTMMVLWWRRSRAAR
ncbi:ABC1 kinase family protein [Streptomyces sp. NPDC087851]|uniref:ABC1 kinase family protein n=1 Tax=Streptomyces sp. NPDC087851 TaxID=3365810 RepID=UPI003813E22C